MNNDRAVVSVRPFAMFLTITAALVVASSISALLQHFLKPGSSSPVVEEPALDVATDSGLVDAIFQLIQELREVKSRDLSVAVADSPSRTIATTSGESVLAELAAAVRELRQTLADRSTAATTFVPPAVTLPPRSHRARLPELPADVINRADAYTRQHLLWSEQEILNGYGMPDRIYVQENGATRWIYKDSEDSNRGFTVHFYQGRVLEIFAL